MINRIAIFVCFLLTVTLLGCWYDVDDGDDDDDDNDAGGNPNQCYQACKNMYNCGGGYVFVYGDVDSCVDDCYEWFDINSACASCVVRCWTQTGGCGEAQSCGWHSCAPICYQY